jgi:hypothetical protein
VSAAPCAGRGADLSTPGAVCPRARRLEASGHSRAMGTPRVPLGSHGRRRGRRRSDPRGGQGLQHAVLRRRLAFLEQPASFFCDGDRPPPEGVQHHHADHPRPAGDDDPSPRRGHAERRPPPRGRLRGDRRRRPRRAPGRRPERARSSAHRIRGPLRRPRRAGGQPLAPRAAGVAPARPAGPVPHQRGRPRAGQGEAVRHPAPGAAAPFPRRGPADPLWALVRVPDRRRPTRGKPTVRREDGWRRCARAGRTGGRSAARTR